METFLPAYMMALAEHLGDFADGMQLVNELLNASQGMMTNEDPSQTLKEVFDRAFYPALGLDYAAVQAPIQEFYENVYPNLKGGTEYRPAAKALVREANARGYRIAIATNPLFPKTATWQRLEWAGLRGDDPGVALVSTYENFHFAKPNPAYFAEVLAQMGWPEGPAAMVGNDAEDDIAAAKSLGLATFWINEKAFQAEVQNGEPPVNGSGKIGDVLQWIDQTGLPKMSMEPTGLTSSMAILKSTPAALGTMLREIPESIWQAGVSKEDLNLTEIVCHLRDTDKEIHLPRLIKMFGENEAIIEAVDTHPWAKERNYQQEDGPEALSQFIRKRIELIEMIAQARDEQWAMHARHTALGPTNALEMVGFMARHDQDHIRQIYEILRLPN